MVYAPEREKTFEVNLSKYKDNLDTYSARTSLKAAESIADFLNQLTQQEIEELATQLEQCASSTVTEEEDALISALTGGRKYSLRERQELESETFLRRFQWRQKLLEGALTAPQVAKLLGTSRQTPHDRVKAGTLLAILDRGCLRFPLWQFDPEGSDAVVEGLPEVLRALDISPLAKANWLTRNNPILDGNSPLEALKQGQKERVLTEARGVGSF